MTCTGCEAKVKQLLLNVPGVKTVLIDLDNGTAEVEMNTHISTNILKTALQDYPKYQLSDLEQIPMISNSLNDDEEKKSWLAIYKPILIIFFYITIITLIVSFNAGNFNILTAMRIFMSGFFLTFSFFKMLDLNGFVESYAMYDIVAIKFRSWGYLYAFIELGLGLGYAIDFKPALINFITLIVMSASIIGVLQSILNKRKIQCACLGAVFNLPMSTVTIIEDGLMIAMSGIMIFIMF